MVAVISRFRVANAREADVARAFQQRPRAVEEASGFLWLEVFVDRDDPAVFYLVTRWTDLDSYERWHASPAHRESHAFIPKGLKLSAEWTRLFTLVRVEGATGLPVVEAVSDATLLFGDVVLQSTELHFIVIGRDGTIRTCNPAACRLLEHDGPWEGRSLMDYMPEPDAERLRGRLSRSGRAASPIRLNVGPANRAPATIECWIDVRSDSATLVGQPSFRTNQRLQDELMAINQELAVLSRDRSREIRDERHGRETAEKLNRERNAFLRVLSHELRQPIGGALAAMGVLRKLNPDPVLERPRALLERQLHQITRLVEDLADTARVAAGDIELRVEPLDLATQLEEMAPAWYEAAQEQHKTFICRLPGHALPVRGDGHRLQQVFSNLIGNALKYTPPSGAVTLSATIEHDASVVVSIQDEGEGIPPDQLSQIFELFQRATTTSSGLGVGLAVVRALVDAHGGSVAAASEGLGRGAVFTVRLPLGPPHSSD
jgi:signal transduction histidine kinase/heme-degrading monooxygenase HmoA